LPAATTERIRALQILARCPNGCREAVMLAYGFRVTFLAALVFDGLVTAELNTTPVVWMQITDLGREVLTQHVAT
jgi:hypothetical protein